jgi:hypothetical protein
MTRAGMPASSSQVEKVWRKSWGPRSWLKGDRGQRIWTGWAILAYNLDTLAIHTS